MQFLPIKRALISVTDKSGLEDLCKGLDEGGVQLVSTGGTRKRILEAGYQVQSVSDVTGFPEILDGRVKTLHPRIHAGVLADKDNPEHARTLEDNSIAPFDLICVNLYDFAQASQKTSDVSQLVEEIDIGGPTLLRAGAKNFHSVTVLPDPMFYPGFLEELKNNDFKVGLDFRQQMAAFVFDLTSKYDALIAQAMALGRHV
jgi:phosphoribosylaminoimidazolecarboxamide formyltransferase/IMP cyclohydrolase